MIQQHHYQAIPAQQDISGVDVNLESPTLERDLSVSVNSQSTKFVTAALQECELELSKSKKYVLNFKNIIDCKKRTNPHVTTGQRVTMPPKNPSKSLTLLWGATGEQEWTPALTTGTAGFNDFVFFTANCKITYCLMFA